jgi:soluble lytic murein transglycosylase-like protein
MSSQMMLGGGVVIAVIMVVLLFKKSPVQPQYVPQKQSMGCFTWALIILAVGLTVYWLPWLFTHLPLSNSPIQVMTTAHPTPVPVKGSRAYYIDVARTAAQAVGINPDVFVRQMDTESGLNPLAKGAMGEIGIAQFMPETARSLGINPANPEQSLMGAAKLMASYVKFFHGSYAMALAAYNAGTGRVLSAITLAQKYGGTWDHYLPVTTQRYIHTILGY